MIRGIAAAALCACGPAAVPAVSAPPPAPPPSPAIAVPRELPEKPSCVGFSAGGHQALVVGRWYEIGWRVEERGHPVVVSARELVR